MSNQMLVECPDCQGTKEYWPAENLSPEDCERCNMKGVVTQSSLYEEERRNLATDNNGQLYVRG